MVELFWKGRVYLFEVLRVFLARFRVLFFSQFFVLFLRFFNFESALRFAVLAENPCGFFGPLFSSVFPFC